MKISFYSSLLIPDWRIQKVVIVVFVTALICSFKLNAQVGIDAAMDGTNTIVDGPNGKDQIITIRGGTRSESGANLFHSFSNFE